MVAVHIAQCTVFHTQIVFARFAHCIEIDTTIQRDSIERKQINTKLFYQRNVTGILNAWNRRCFGGKMLLEEKNADHEPSILLH